MDIVYSFISREIVEALGWTLFHSLWQGALVAILFGLLLLALPKFSAHTRYIISMVALFIVLGLSVTTFVRTYRYAVEKEKLREQVVANPGAALEQFKATLAEAGKTNINSTIDSKWMLKWVIFKTYFQRQFPLIVLIWMLGMLVLMLRFMGGLIYANRMKYRGIFPADDNWVEVTRRFSGKLSIKRAVAIYQSAMTKIPVTLGYIKPVVLIPISIFTNVPPVQIENIIAHELAHVARYDYLFNILQRFVEILFFYHPAV